MFLPILYSLYRPACGSTNSWGKSLLQLCLLWTWPASSGVFRFFAVTVLWVWRHPQRTTMSHFSAKRRTWPHTPSLQPHLKWTQCFRHSSRATFAPHCQSGVWCWHGPGLCDPYWSKRKNTAFVGSLIYPSGGQTQVDPWAVKEITQQADLHAATDAEKGATSLVVATSKGTWLLMGRESTGGCITITYTSLASFIISNTHNGRTYGSTDTHRDRTGWEGQTTFYAHNNQKLLLPLTIN